jgi:hypothetical protein
MDSKMIKGCVAGLLLAVSGFVNAGLFKYDMTFQGGSRDAFVEGYGRIVADSDSDAIVLFAMKSTNSTPGFEVDFLWEGVIDMYKTQRYFNVADLVHVDSFAILNSANDSILYLDNELTIWGLPSDRYAHRLDDHRRGEFFSFLSFSGEANGRLFLNLTITKDVPESSSLVLFALGLMGLISRRFKKQA